MNKPVIPRNVAAAIESFRSDGWSSGRIVRISDCRDEHGQITERQDALRRFVITADNFDTLLAALVNGYEIEKTAEEVAEEERYRAFTGIRKRYDYLRGNTGNLYARCSADEIASTLNQLGIKIEGVNA